MSKQKPPKDIHDYNEKECGDAQGNVIKIFRIMHELTVALQKAEARIDKLEQATESRFDNILTEIKGINANIEIHDTYIEEKLKGPLATFKKWYGIGKNIAAIIGILAILVACSLFGFDAVVKIFGLIIKAMAVLA